MNWSNGNEMTNLHDTNLMYLNVPDACGTRFSGDYFQSSHSAPTIEQGNRYELNVNAVLGQNHLSGSAIEGANYQHHQYGHFHRPVHLVGPQLAEHYPPVYPAYHHRQMNDDTESEIIKFDKLFSNLVQMRDGSDGNDARPTVACGETENMHQPLPSSSNVRRPNVGAKDADLEMLLAELDHDSGVESSPTVRVNAMDTSPAMVAMGYNRSPQSNESTTTDANHAAMSACQSADDTIPSTTPISGHCATEYSSNNLKNLLVTGLNDLESKSRSYGHSGPPTSFKSSPLNVSRTNLKLILQREQVQEQERREQKSQRTGTVSAPTAGNAVSSANTAAVAAAVTVPAAPTRAVGAKMDVPKEVLKVHTRLQNPTHYHVVAEQKRQLQEFLNTTLDVNENHPILVHSMPNVEAAPSSSAPYISSSAPSPDSPNSVGLSSSAATSASEADIIDSIIQMEDHRDIDEFLQMSTMPSTTEDLLNVYKLKQTGGVAAKSCPPEVVNNSFSTVQLEQYHKERIKKDNHNMIERRRRYNINDRIKELATLLPRSTDPHRQNKGTILKESVDYIKHMNKMKDVLENETQERKRLEQENKKLRLLTQQLIYQFNMQMPQPGQTIIDDLSVDPGVVVKQEPLEHMVDSDLSRTTMDDIMDDDQHPVNGDPMLAAPHDMTLNDEMDFIS